MDITLSDGQTGDIDALVALENSCFQTDRTSARAFARALIIEVNDNPNIDAGIEDKLTGPDLYHRLMPPFQQRFLLARDRARI